MSLGANRCAQCWVLNVECWHQTLFWLYLPFCLALYSNRSTTILKSSNFWQYWEAKGSGNCCRIAVLIIFDITSLRRAWSKSMYCCCVIMVFFCCYQHFSLIRYFFFYIRIIRITYFKIAFLFVIFHGWFECNRQRNILCSPFISVPFIKFLIITSLRGIMKSDINWKRDVRINFKFDISFFVI